MADADRQRWDAKYAIRSADAPLAPDAWLQELVGPLSPGRAIDLACGAGDNALWLAQQGWQVDAVDISPVGLALANERARRAGVAITTIAADIDDYSPEPASYDLAIVFRFLERLHLPRLIVEALRPGGCLIYETFNRRHLLLPDVRMRDPAFALEPGELLRLYAKLEPLRSESCELENRSVDRLFARKKPDE